MRFDEIEAALEQAKKHVDEASLAATFADMRIQLRHAQNAANRALEGIATQVRGSLAQAPIRAALPPKARKRRR